ncbi:MAG: hypothetical protein LQ352_000822 [Teloschistes flavicans]|nr:MAG: hypothetical protein LQ352_000822 [Teloschistes flavicans]
MRHSNRLPLALLLYCSSLPSIAAAVFPHDIQSHASSSIPVFLRQSAPSRSIATRLRDGLIRTLWSVPRNGPSSASEPQQPISSGPATPPSTLLARYGGDLVLRFDVPTPEEVAALAQAINVLFLDVWESNSNFVDIRVSKDVVPSLLGLLPPSLQHAHTPLMHDLSQSILENYNDEYLPTRESHRPFSPVLQTSQDTDQTNIFFRNYQPFSVIVPWMRLLASLFPTHVRLIDIGLSYEGRDIPALCVGAHPTNNEKPSGKRPMIVISGGSHAREWISTSTVNYVAYTFITSYGKNEEMTKMIEKFDWVFIPTLNPDGYVYTWETDRLWRKNRQQTSLRFCRGLDLDHAYGFEWDSNDMADNPCSESFAGEAPFEAVEARRFATWARNQTENENATIVAFVDFHSYSQQILYPYSYTCATAPPTLENLEELAIGMVKAIRLTNSEQYSITSACEGSFEPTDGTGKRTKYSKPQRFESVGGSPIDYFYHSLGVKYSYQIKLRDTGSYGFLLPSRNIVPTGKEAFSAMKYLARFLMGDKGIEEEEGKGESQSVYEGEQVRAEVVGKNSKGMGGEDEGEHADEEVGLELKRRRRR